MPKDAKGHEIQIGDLTNHGQVLGFFIDIKGWHVFLAGPKGPIGPQPVYEPAELIVERVCEPAELIVERRWH